MLEEIFQSAISRALAASVVLHVTVGALYFNGALQAVTPPWVIPIQVTLRSVPPAPLPAPIPIPLAADRPQRHEAQPILTRSVTPDAPPATLSVPAAAEPLSGTTSASTTQYATPTISASEFNAAYLNNPAPDYPATARRRQQQGTTFLDVRVGADGHPLSVAVSRSSGASELDEAARKAVLGWTFVPAKRGDRSIEGSVEVPVRFRLAP